MILNSISKLSLIFLALGFLTACNSTSSDQQKIIGKWIQIGSQEKTLDFKEDGTVLRDKKDKLNYLFEREGFIKLEGAGRRKEEYQIAFKGDTLITLDAETRKKFFRVSSLDKPEFFRFLVADQLTSTMRKECVNVVVTKTTVADLPDSVHLQPKFLRAVKPTTEIYLADAIFKDRSTTQPSILIKKKKDGYIIPVWRETVEAFTQRSTFALIGLKTTKIMLKETKKGKYKGQIFLEDGNLLNIDLDTKKGWIPNDTQSMEVFTTYFIDRELGKKQCERVSLTTEDNYHYTGIAHMTDGQQLHIQTDKLKGWGVKNTMEDAKIYITYRILNGIGSTVQSLDVKKLGNKEYKVRAKLSEGDFATLFVSPEYRGWYPEDNANNLAVVVKYQMNAGFVNDQKEGEAILKVVNVKIGPHKTKEKDIMVIKEGQYIGLAILSDGTAKKLMVYHKGKSFKWEVTGDFVPPENAKTSS